MNDYDKLKVLKAANWLIDQLLYCGDCAFVDRVIDAIACGEQIECDEAQESAMNEYCEEGENYGW